ncbi:MAG: hypothetical protein LBU90_00475 [Bacteroidales bacterium]|jgi:hypothetical protein|nr:hypothetical protein [Bacteroidales bacterium]
MKKITTQVLCIVALCLLNTNLSAQCIEVKGVSSTAGCVAECNPDGSFYSWRDANKKRHYPQAGYTFKNTNTFPVTIEVEKWRKQYVKEYTEKSPSGKERVELIVVPEQVMETTTIVMGAGETGFWQTTTNNKPYASSPDQSATETYFVRFKAFQCP